MFGDPITISWSHSSEAAVARRDAPPASQRRSIRGKYDVATPGGQNDRHFAQADDLGPNSANSPEIRLKLRRYCRYEIANNSYCKGVVLTWANELIGRGPRLQMRYKDRVLNALFEQHWRAWDIASGFSEKLHVFAQSKIGDGEGQAVIIANPQVRHPIKLDIHNIEAEMLTTPFLQLKPNAVDGIVFDRAKNPLEYHVLNYHPGEGAIWGQPNYFGTNDYAKISPRNMLHWFRVDRPGQCRGIPEITSCLSLFAQLRRWTAATLTGAETAANFAAILHSDGSATGFDPADPWDEVEVRMGTMTTLPQGWRMSQFTPTQPVATYHAFKIELLKEIARCLNMPFNVVGGDSSFYNYASGRLDYQNWHRAVRVARASFERIILEHVFREWLTEAVLAIPAFYNLDLTDVPHGWFWDAVQHVDPVKDGTGDALALANNTDTLANICADQGMDWEEVLQQRSIETMRIEELGLFPTSVVMDVKRAVNDAKTGQPEDPESEPNQPEPVRASLARSIIRAELIKAFNDTDAAPINGNGRGHHERS